MGTGEQLPGEAEGLRPGGRGRGLPDAPMPDTCALTRRPSLSTSPVPGSHPRSEGPGASPSAKWSQSASLQALSPAARTAPPAPLSVGSTSRVSAPPQAGRKGSAAPSGAIGAGAGSRLKPEAPRAEGKAPHVMGGAGVTAPRLSPCVAAALLPGLRFCHGLLLHSLAPGVQPGDPSPCVTIARLPDAVWPSPCSAAVPW